MVLLSETKILISGMYRQHDRQPTYNLKILLLCNKCKYKTPSRSFGMEGI